MAALDAAGESNGVRPFEAIVAALCGLRAHKLMAALDTAGESNGVWLFEAISDAKVVKIPGREDI